MKTETERLRSAIVTGAAMIQPYIKWADPLALIAALAEVESDFGVANRPRYERQYDQGGFLYNRSKEQQERIIQWGAWAACSYSSFQIMYSTACELGYDRAPWTRSPGDLFNDETAVIFVVEYIKRRILDRGAKSIKEFAIAYNGGNPKAVNNMTLQYAQKFDHRYAGVLARRNLGTV